ncbi:nitroreductase family protein [Candidatus Methanomassiliicoccus intestinalis]|uniref:nitroreductase family protein n=1 Tax=Candidatus Methanomassiliicoccus intestinalis TaxID=1406512 RepID=UPI0037DD4775
MNTYLEAIKNRRSIYGLEKSSPISNDEICKLAEDAMLHTPSPFNMQSSRVLVLFGPNHDRLWEIVMNALRKKVPADKFSPTETKIKSFAEAYGTILYFDDTTVTSQYAEKFHTYRDNFPTWAQQANAILQYNIWNLLAESGLGASLQHYNPLIDAEVKQTWNIPDDWLLIAQMPFGTQTAAPAEKTFIPTNERIFRYD